MMRSDGLPGAEAGARDFLYLLDRLEEALTAGSRVPLTARTLVDEGECLDVVDQLRLALPHELREARRILAERDHMLTQARDQAERLVRAAELRAGRLVEEAELRAGRLVEDHAVVREARSRAVQIEDRAERTADQIRTEAEQYAGQLLGRVGDRLEQALGTVRSTLKELEAGDVPSR